LKTIGLICGMSRESRCRTAGADFLVLCTNTMHKVAPAIETAEIHASSAVDFVLGNQWRPMSGGLPKPKGV
jgi:aspartate/glutamate racemase